ncbi:MAG: hypothetical protein ACOC1S_02935 [bacterium]
MNKKQSEEGTLSFKLKRKDSYFGLHFDFHADRDCEYIGENTTREMLEELVSRVKPDFIQCDCKGHPGLSSYSTEVGYAAPGITKDALKLWREVTAEYGVSLYVHYSGVIDREACQKHPEWARINEKGEPDEETTSTFKSYVDGILIPQFKELIDKYNIDGVWVDGECWGTKRDYCEKAVNKFKEKYGVEEIPRTPEDPNFYEYNEFCREQFRKYLDYYTQCVHKYDPEFEIASNWAYTSFMPEPVETEVDFISGDYSSLNSINTARFEGRCIRHQKKPWDLMAWSFCFDFDNRIPVTKSVPQLQQEAAMVLSLGGGFQSYFQQKKDGSISLWHIDIMEELAQFCLKRQPYCQDAESVPQIGLFYSGKTFYRETERLFAPWEGELKPLQGILQSLLDSQNSVDILMEHHLREKLEKYPLIIVPEWKHLEGEIKSQLTQYAAEGGNLLVIGAEAVFNFKEELGVEFIGKLKTEVKRWLEYDNFLSGILTNYQPVNSKGTETAGKLYLENDNTGVSEVAATINNYGKGKIGGIYFNYGERYLKAATPATRNFLNYMVKKLFPDPVVEVEGSQKVDLVVNQIEEKLAVNLINTSGPHADDNVYVYDEIPPVGPLLLKLRLEKEPKKIIQQPQGRELDFTKNDEITELKIPEVKIHDIIIVDNQF